MFKQIGALIAFIQNHFKAVILVLIVALMVLAPKQQPPNMYRIDLYGEIFNADQFLEQVEAAKADNIHGVLLVVDSPGGALAPSVEMMMAIRELREMNKPIVAYAQGTMASGSYYASIWADEIVANPGAIIGSIGVLMQGLNAEKLLDVIGLEFNVAKAGDYKEVGAFYRKQTAIEKEQIQTLLSDIYDMFVSDVAKARDLDLGQSKDFANGRVFTPKKAIEAGLIDRVGSLTMAENLVVELAKKTLKDNKPIWNQKSEAQKFMEMLKEQSKVIASELSQTSVKAKIDLQ